MTISICPLQICDFLAINLKNILIWQLPNLLGLLLSCQTVKNKYCVSKTSSTRDRFGTKVTSAEKKDTNYHSQQRGCKYTSRNSNVHEKKLPTTQSIGHQSKSLAKTSSAKLSEDMFVLSINKVAKLEGWCILLSPFFYLYRFLRGDVEVQLRLMTMLQNTLNNDLLTSSSTFPITLMRND